mmetsp:Transcript_2341/g.3388  ORF Transcript_2341/g.3388 Transcript_2341/m.3388 type:complete len:235 (-) Transcript_2341:8430-9134(-)
MHKESRCGTIHVQFVVLLLVSRQRGHRGGPRWCFSIEQDEWDVLALAQDTHFIVININIFKDEIQVSVLSRLVAVQSQRICVHNVVMVGVRLAHHLTCVDIARCTKVIWRINCTRIWFIAETWADMTNASFFNWCSKLNTGLCTPFNTTPVYDKSGTIIITRILVLPVRGDRSPFIDGELGKLLAHSSKASGERIADWYGIVWMHERVEVRLDRNVDITSLEVARVESVPCRSV